MSLSPLQKQYRNLPRLTGPYEYKIPSDMEYELTDEELEEGWRLIRDQSRDAMAKSKIKLRTENDYLGDAGERLRTWEVINEYAIASYDIMANSAYQKAIGGTCNRTTDACVIIAL